HHRLGDLGQGDALAAAPHRGSAAQADVRAAARRGVRDLEVRGPETGVTASRHGDRRLETLGRLGNEFISTTMLPPSRRPTAWPLVLRYDTGHSPGIPKPAATVRFHRSQA